jgi:hypothetical protein
MDRRPIILYFHLEELSAHGIHDDLVVTHGPMAMAYSTVTYYFREAKLGTAEVTLGPEPSSPHLEDSDRAVLAAQEEMPFSSMRKHPFTMIKPIIHL